MSNEIKSRAGSRNNVRKFAGPGPRADRNDKKKAEAKERLEFWQSLTPQKQLEELDRRLGKDVGAVKQRLRLHALIASKTKLVQSDTSEPKKEKKSRAKDRRAEGV